MKTLIALFLITVFANALVSVEIPPAVITWKPWSKGVFAGALLSGKPVFVAVSAKWDVASAYNRKHVLSDGDVASCFISREVIALSLDYTDRERDTDDFVRSEGLAVPAYLIYSPGVRKPRILTDILNKAELIGAIEQSTAKTAEPGATANVYGRHAGC
jgi:thiol:disulfide interchange protein